MTIEEMRKIVMMSDGLSTIRKMTADIAKATDPMIRAEMTLPVEVLKQMLLEGETFCVGELKGLGQDVP